MDVYRLREYVDAAGVGERGSCHLFRHTMATLMLEGGADIRYVQAMLGFDDTATTEIYTRVSIRALQEVHERTHPGGSPQKPRKRRGRAAPARPLFSRPRPRRSRRRDRLEQ
jgi:integrase/recombinase XerD